MLLVLNSNNMDSKDSKTLSEICVTLINQYYFLLAFNLLQPQSQIYKHIYVIISQNNFTSYKADKNLHLTPMFKNNRCWFEYTTKSLQSRDKTMLCVVKQLLLDLEIHKHEYTFEMAEINQETPYYLYLCNILEHFKI